MVFCACSPADLRREEHGPYAIQAAGAGRPKPPRYLFGGGNRIAGGAADGELDDLLAAIDVLLGGLRPGPSDVAGLAARLRAELGRARKACEQGRLGLARCIVELVRGR